MRTMFLTSVIAFFLIIQLTGSAYGWEIEKVDDWNGISDSDICLDNANNPHIIYISDDSSDTSAGLKYATKNGDWTIEIIDDSNKGSSTGRFSNINIKLDSNNKPHVMYIFDNEIRYANKANGQWQYVTLDTEGSSGVDLVIDNDDIIHASYWSERYLEYVFLNDTGWNYSILYDRGTNTGGGMSNILIKDNSPHVFTKLQKTAKPDIYHFHLSNTTWTDEIIYSFDHSNFAIFDISSEILDDSICLCFNDEGIVTLLKQKDNDWNKEIAYNMKDWDQWTFYPNVEMNIHQDDSIYISITEMDYDPEAPKYMLVLLKETNGGWSNETLAEDKAQFSSMDIDKAGNIHISFVEYGTGEIKYIYGNFEESSVEETPGFGFELIFLATIISIVLYRKRK